MKDLNITVYETGDRIATLSKEGVVRVFTVNADGGLTPGTTPFDNETPIEALDLSTRAYNVLKREGINTIIQLLNAYDTNGVEGLKAMRNLGDSARDELLAQIRRMRGTIDETTDETTKES